ncbi:short chain dehydrogenase [Seiridium cupressi]
MKLGLTLLGRSIALRFGKTYPLVLLARKHESFDSIVTEINEAGGSARGIAADVSDSAALKAALESVGKELPGSRLAAAVLNVNAGFLMKPFLETKREDLETSLNGSAGALFSFAQNCMPLLLDSVSSSPHPPSLIITGATASLKASANLSSFAAGRFALRALGQSLAREFGPQGVHVAHAIIDGLIDTPRVREHMSNVKEGTMISPEAIADSYWYLHTQHPSAFTQELDLRPHMESSAKNASPKPSGVDYRQEGGVTQIEKNGAVGMNPFDWVLQYQASTITSHLQYTMVIGVDVAGNVFEVGPDITRFRVGGRVAGNAVSLAKESNNASEGVFQLYTVMRQNMVASIHDHVTDEQAAVLGLGIGTTAYGLFHQTGKESPRAIIVTGGASSVGSCAIQLAASTGYEVLSTSSPKKFAYVKGLGVTHIFDYNSETLVADLVRALEGRELHGAFTVGADADQACVSFMKELLSKKLDMFPRKFVSLAGVVRRGPDSFKGLLCPWRMVSGMMAMIGIPGTGIGHEAVHSGAESTSDWERSGEIQ